VSMLLSQVFIYVKAPMHINSHTKFQLVFSKFQFLNGQNGQEGGTASLCQILSQSLQPWPRYRDFSICQHGRKGQEGRSASVCQISSKSLELRPRYGEQQNDLKFTQCESKKLDTSIFAVTLPNVDQFSKLCHF